MFGPNNLVIMNIICAPKKTFLQGLSRTFLLNKIKHVQFMNVDFGGLIL